MAKHNEFGDWGEALAERYLTEKGYVIMERDWRFGKRDVDIIAQTKDGLEVVFVEVKTRRSDEIFDPIAAVTPAKMRNIGYCANAYLKYYNLDMEPRYDIITIVKGEDTEAKITHIEDAFNPCLI